MVSASQACGSMPLSLAVPIMEYMKAARCPPRSDPAKSQDFRPKATPRRARSAALFVRLRIPAHPATHSDNIRPLIPGHPATL